MSDFAAVVTLLSLVSVATPLSDAAPWLARPLVALPVDPAVLTLFSAGVVGMSIKNVFDSILSDDESDDAEGGEQMGDGSGLMGEEGDDDLGGLGGFDEGGDDEFGDFGDDEFGDMDGGGGGADTDELQHRLDELENEVGSLSSTVNTVRNENEQISETVDDVEENVRKLLDIYEMVTRGVNPFADDIDGGGLGGGGEDSFGLFDGDDEEEKEEELDEDIANADAEGFFDDDLVEDEGDDFGGSVEDVMGGGGGDSGPGAEDAFEEEFNDDFEMGDGDDVAMDDGFGDDMAMDDDFDDGASMDDSGSDDGGDGGGGKSFQELKDEYESGDAEWAEGEEPAEGGDAGAFDDEGDLDGVDGGFGDDLVEDDSDDAGGEDLADDDLFDTVIEEEPDDEETAEAAQTTEPEPEPEPTTEAEPAAEPEPTTDTEPETAPGSAAESEPTGETAPEPTTETTASQTGSADTATNGGEGKPYLGTLPEGFGMELIVVEWLEYLVEEVGIRSTAEAIDYYERIDWISESVADDLQNYLRGFETEGASGELTIDHHTQSLQFIGQLNGGAPETSVMGHLFSGGGSDGLQR